MEQPTWHQEELVQAVNPVFRDYMAPNEARRMGNLMKRALTTTLKVLADTGIEHPDAIITGTSLGSLDYTDRLLNSLTDNGEEALSPTYFMQSTHNTVGSALAIYTKTKGYNTTYSHGSISFDYTVLDAWMQMQLGHIDTALVGGHDEMIESYFLLLKKAGYVGVQGMVPCGEVSMSMMLTTHDTVDRLCEIAAIHICSCDTVDMLQQQLQTVLDHAGITLSDVSAVMTGINGNPANDKYYSDAIPVLFPDKPLLHYKHLFGENYTVSALGLYAAAHLLKKQSVPDFMYDAASPSRCNDLQHILLLNSTGSDSYSFILLRKI